MVPDSTSATPTSAQSSTNAFTLSEDSIDCLQNWQIETGESADSGESGAGIDQVIQAMRQCLSDDELASANLLGPGTGIQTIFEQLQCVGERLGSEVQTLLLQTGDGVEELPLPGVVHAFVQCGEIVQAAAEPLSIAEPHQCAIKALGEARYLEISLGPESVSQEELRILEDCDAISGVEVANVDSCRDPAIDESERSLVAPSSTHIRFIDVADAANVDFRHSRDGALMNLGGGAAIGDYNGDALLDLYVTNSAGPNALYRNNGDGTFSDVAVAAGVSDPVGRGNGAGWGDYDNDGDLDLFVANFGASVLFRNDGAGSFTDVTIEAGVGDPDATYRTTGITWGDYDQDGLLDLLVVRYLSEADLTAFKTRDFSSTTRPLALYRNAGDGTFKNVTSFLGDSNIYPSNVKGAGFKPTFVDYDNDGDVDIYVVNDFGIFIYPNVLWRNDGSDGSGGWSFTDVSASSRTDAAIYGMGLAAGDYDNDGDLDLYVTDCGASEFLENQGDDTFVNTTRETGTGRGVVPESSGIDLSFGWGAVFVDLDNDGLLDLYYVAGQMDSDPLINPEHQPNAVFLNLGDGTFQDVSPLTNADDPGLGREVAYADFNNDGLLDLYVVNLGTLEGIPGIARLFQNSSEVANHWISIKPVGTISNRDGMGARITLTAGGITQIREIGAGQGHQSHSVVPAHFGVGTATVVDAIEIRWPSGIIQSLSNISTDQLVTVIESR